MKGPLLFATLLLGTIEAKADTLALIPPTPTFYAEQCLRTFGAVQFSGTLIVSGEPWVIHDVPIYGNRVAVDFGNELVFFTFPIGTDKAAQLIHQIQWNLIRHDPMIALKSTTGEYFLLTAWDADQCKGYRLPDPDTPA